MSIVRQAQSVEGAGAFMYDDLTDEDILRLLGGDAGRSSHPQGSDPSALVREALVRATSHARQRIRTAGVAVDDVEDVLQDTLIRVDRARLGFDADRAQWKTFVQHIAGRATADYFRALYRRPAALRFDADRNPGIARQQQASPFSSEDVLGLELLYEAEIEEGSHWATDREVKNWLVDILGPRKGTVVYLRIVEEYSYEEVAAELDIRAGTARVTLSRALQELKRHLGWDW